MRLSSFRFPGVHALSLVVILAASLGLTCSAAEPWQELQEQNRLMRAQLETQQRQLDELRTHLNRLEGGADAAPVPAPGAGRGAADRTLVITGEVGIAYFGATENGQYANQEFRVDDANLRFDASVAKDIYLFGELQLAKREALNQNFNLGEFYVEFENVSGALGGPDRLLNLRLGRVDIPFGEEYQHRDPLLNPLVTHSLSDVWGTDEGVEFYGDFGRASYAFAVQNGSSRTMRDFNSDKSLAGRIGFGLTRALHLSASAMRTGELDSGNEPLSEVWLGNNVFRNIGSAGSTIHQGELAQIDASYRWSSGSLGAAAGRARYRDNDPLADNTRRFSYWQVEGVQSLTSKFYGAARFSTLRVNHGYPLAGIGNFSRYFLGALQTKEMERLTLGGGYRFTRSVVLKLDYTLEEARLTTGASRDTRMISLESAVGF